MKELFFIYKECGFADTLFYFFYKVRLWIRLNPIVKKRNEKRLSRIENIYEKLSQFQNPLVTVNGNKYLQKKIDYSKYGYVLLRTQSSDINVFQQVIQFQEYKSVVDIYSQLFLHPPQQIFDCGANIGLTSIYFYHLFPNAFYTLIEPFKDNIELIKLNFERIGIKNFLLLEGGIWNKDTKLSICRKFRDKKEWSINLIEEDSLSNNVIGFSLLSLIEKVGTEIDILKIDIEGTEKLLFENEDYAKMFLEKVKCIAIEIHDEFNCRNTIYNILKTNNYFYFNSNELTICINRTYLR